MDRVKSRLSQEMPGLSAFFSSGGLIDGVVNMGMPAPIDVRVSGTDLNADYKIAQNLAAQFRSLPDAGDVYVPQDLDYPSLRLDIECERASWGFRRRKSSQT